MNMIFSINLQYNHCRSQYMIWKKSFDVNLKTQFKKIWNSNPLWPAESITYSRLLPEATSSAGCELTWHCSKPGLGAGVGMPERPCAGEGNMNESMWFTRTHEDTVHPPPSEVANWSLQCQRRGLQQEETPSYSSSLYTPHKWLLCLREKTHWTMSLCTVQHKHAGQ